MYVRDNRILYAQKEHDDLEMGVSLNSLKNALLRLERNLNILLREVDWTDTAMY